MDEERMTYRTRVRVVQHFNAQTFEDAVNLAVAELEQLGRTIIDIRAMAQTGDANLVAFITYGWYEPISAP